MTRPSSNGRDVRWPLFSVNHEEVSADYNDMIYGASKPEIEAKRKAFIRK